MSMSPVLRGLVASLVLLASTPLVAQDAEELAAGLIRLRGDVEQLHAELDVLREEQRASLAGLNAQKAELQAAVDRQQLAARELRAKLAGQQAAAAQAGVAGEALRPILSEAIAGLEAYVQAGLPFKREERLGELAAFRAQVQNGSLPPPRAVNRLWGFYEDELRLTRDNSLHSQTIGLDGERVLAEVAKLGTVALYFRTQDGRLGQAVHRARDWAFVPFEDDADSARVEVLFDALRKQIRQGFFELPLAGGAAR